MDHCHRNCNCAPAVAVAEEEMMRASNASASTIESSSFLSFSPFRCSTLPLP
jgi:hypothetical protein